MKIYYINETEYDYDTGYTYRVAQEFGYFIDEAEAQAFIVSQRKKELITGYDDYVKRVEASNKTASDQYEEAKRKHDYMVAGGFASRAPGTPTPLPTDSFDKWRIYATVPDYDVESLDPHTYDGVG